MASQDHIHFDRTDGGLQRLAARFGGHAYDLHRHETYAVGLTTWGAQSFHYRGGLQTSAAGQVMVIHPDEAHDGHAGVDEGFAYRMLYIDPGAVSAALGTAATPFVPDVVSDDPALADLLREAFADFPRPLEPIAADAIVGHVAERLAARCDSGVRLRRQPTAHRAVGRARDFLIAEAPRTVASEELEKVSGLDRFALGPALPCRLRHLAAPLPGRPTPRARPGNDRRGRAALRSCRRHRLRRPEPSHPPLRRALRTDPRPVGRPDQDLIRTGVDHLVAIEQEQAGCGGSENPRTCARSSTRGTPRVDTNVSATPWCNRFAFVGASSPCSREPEITKMHRRS